MIWMLIAKTGAGKIFIAQKNRSMDAQLYKKSVFQRFCISLILTMNPEIKLYFGPTLPLAAILMSTRIG